MTPLILALVLTQSPVVFPAPPTDAEWKLAKCVHLIGGDVHCGEDTFKALVDSLIDAEAAADKLSQQVQARDVQLQALKAALAAVPPPEPSKTNAKPLVAVVTAVLGTAAISAAALDSNLSTGARVGLGITGAAAVAGSFVIVF